jgi:hypothetical protein
MKPGTRVRLAAPLTYDQLDNLGLKTDEMVAAGKDVDDIAVWVEVTGEFRPVRAGEWFVSGAIPEAYQASRDIPAVRLTDCRYIARLRWEGDYPFDFGDELLVASMAVVERWNSPLWKDLPATALYIQRLERAAKEFERRADGATGPH